MTSKVTAVVSNGTLSGVFLSGAQVTLVCAGLAPEGMSTCAVLNTTRIPVSHFDIYKDDFTGEHTVTVSAFDEKGTAQLAVYRDGKELVFKTEKQAQAFAATVIDEIDPEFNWEGLDISTVV